MKQTLPKEVHDATAQITARREVCASIRADIERAGGAAAEAERLDGEIQALSKKRVELKAQAFISRQPADLVELDRQQDELERASRIAIEDGQAAAVAIGLLQEQLAQVELDIEQAIEQRRQLVLAWLVARREKAIDSYMKAIVELGAFVAEASAMDVVRRRLGESTYLPGERLRADYREIDLPVPYDRRIPHGNEMCRAQGMTVNPVTWLRTHDLGDAERDVVLADRRAEGVLV